MQEILSDYEDIAMHDNFNYTNSDYSSTIAIA